MSERAIWLQMLEKLATPPLEALAKRELAKSMPCEQRGTGREDYLILETFGRLMAGMAPWLATEQEDEAEEVVRRQLWTLAQEAIDVITDPVSPDYANFSVGQQPIVDTGFLSQSILRCPALYVTLSTTVKNQLVHALKASRSRKPHPNNWLLFSATTEAALYILGEDWDPMRVDYALRQHEQWYAGDGHYQDGPEFHMDYYNSFVILPMLYDITQNVPLIDDAWRQMKEEIPSRLSRYAAIQERLISPEGTYPAVGRSLAYRFGCLHALGMAAYEECLPECVANGQVRAALTEVLKRQMYRLGTFDENGWLTLGFAGHQPLLAESYISTGSTYLAALGFVPLGLKASHPFWSEEAKPWTAVQVWGGKNVPADMAKRGTPFKGL
ncbi:DUF2264 domain-containing protein [Bacillaceae bacterium SIJ1]|nr:DUF2264 domain-containing protein [Litoribacterium kuwaitense]